MNCFASLRLLVPCCVLVVDAVLLTAAHRSGFVCVVLVCSARLASLKVTVKQTSACTTSTQRQQRYTHACACTHAGTCEYACVSVCVCVPVCVCVCVCVCRSTPSPLRQLELRWVVTVAPISSRFRALCGCVLVYSVVRLYVYACMHAVCV